MHPASGGATFKSFTTKAIRLARHGCANRPFFHIVVMEKRKEQFDHVIEQVGSFDPLPNQYNEKLVAFNFERIRFWLGKGATASRPVVELLGLASFYPIHPRTYMTAWRNRVAAAAAQADSTENQCVKLE
ncbi:hypothetical protein PR048_009871 [Dryococelus australis]|uniref:Small ribosomal subunit protein bS16m n=1 Tax=Dryococelus australis TaxID=614101 RepID=A0ABQ9I2Z9_9NEOP|nr:hypothetical protein PR048_009871 [Dryococelus australis]